MSRVAIIGSGFIGRAWAISFARAGHNVAIWDPVESAPGAALAYIAELLPDLDKNGLLNGASPAELLSRIQPGGSLEATLADADYVQENAPEVLDTKRELFARMDPLTPAGAIIASSTSALLPSAFTDHVAGRERCLVVHPINPPYLIPAAEVVPAPWTAPDTVSRAAAFLKAAGHAPIVMKQEIDGFVMNRLQGALLEEAFRLVADGIASAEDVDIGIRDGLALRWSFMGPFETIDLNAPGGVRDYAERYQGIYSGIWPSTQRRIDWAGSVMDAVEPERRAKVPAADLPKRQAWRDRRLMALLAHKRRAASDIGT